MRGIIIVGFLLTIVDVIVENPTMGLRNIAGLMLVILNGISAKRSCEIGYYSNGTTCLHCRNKPALNNLSGEYMKWCSFICSKRSYGPYCSDRCSRNCQNMYCNRWTGSCIYGCYNGWYGDTCDMRCNTGCISGLCDRDGTCIGGCKTGYYGDRCVKCPQNCADCLPQNGCQKCKPGYYGKLCQSTCQNCNGLICDIFTGRCGFGCKTPWHGKKCSERCPANCNSISCTAGVCDSCKRGYRGLHCNMSCPQYCERCHQHQNNCLVCQQGRYGVLCDKTCDNCNSNECDIKGNCSTGCEVNYYGNKCDRRCSKFCKTEIGISIDCSEKSGICTHGCIDGWYSQKCDRKCNPGCTQSICDPTTGACTEGCSNSFYGTYCNLSCSPNCVDRACTGDHTDDVRCNHGCTEGWWGPFCEYQCPEKCLKCQIDTGMCDQCITNTTHGQNCNQACSDGCVGQDCDMTGVCRQGCALGWMGTKCQVSTLWFLLPGCGTAVLLLVCVSLCWFDSRKQHDTEAGRTDEDRPLTMLMMKHDLTDIPGDNDLAKLHNESQHIKELDLPRLKAENFVSKRSVSTKISLDHFREYVRMQTMTGGIIKQHKRLPVNPVYPCYEGDLSQSVVKNRYGNILPYDYNRVVLDNNSAKLSSDYINASYIKGYTEKESFIATQGPFSEVIGEFWTMIWQKNVSKIVMLTNCVENNRRKCDLYWPNMDQAQMITPGVIVECLSATVDEYFTVRTFILTQEGNGFREIKQFHFTNWPDCDVPDNMTSLLSLHKAVTRSNRSAGGPVVVHCSAGVGRTGTYIALDYLIQQAKTEGEVDVFECVLRLRHQRMNLVQTEEQYMLLYNILLQVIDSLSDAGMTTVRQGTGRGVAGTDVS